MPAKIRRLLTMASLFCYTFLLAALPCHSVAQAVPDKPVETTPVGPQLVVQDWHAQDVRAAVFSPDGALMATMQGDGTVKIWDRRSDALLRSCAVGESERGRPIFSPDSKTLAMSDAKGALLLDPYTGKHLLTLSSSRPLSLAFSPDSSTLVLGDAEETISFWNYHTGNHLRSIRAHVGEVEQLQFSPDGSLLACAAGESTHQEPIVEIWSVPSGETFRTLKTHGEVHALAFSPNGRTLAVGSGRFPDPQPIQRYGIELWDIRKGVRQKTLVGHDLQVKSLAYSPDGAALVAVDAIGAIRVWKPTSGGVLRKIGGVDHPLDSVLVSPNARLVSLCDRDSAAHVYDTTTGKQQFFGMRAHEMKALAVCEDGKTLVVAGGRRQGQAETGEILFWDMRTGVFKGTLSWGQEVLRELSVTPDGRLLAVTDGENVALWNIPAKRLLGVLGKVPNEERSFHTLAFSPDGRSVAIGGTSRQVQGNVTPAVVEGSSEEHGFLELWDVATHQRLRTFHGAQDAITTAAFSRDGKTLFSNGSGRDVVGWDVPNGTIRQKLSGAEGARSTLTLSADGVLLAAFGDGYDGQIWDLKEGGKPYALPAPADHTVTAALSPDRRRIAIGGPGGSITLWNLTDTTRGPELGGEGASLDSVAYLPNGSAVVGLDRECGIRIWDPATGRLKATLIPLGKVEAADDAKAWIAFTPDGYYAASENAETYLRWRVPGKLLSGNRYRAERLQPTRLEQSLTERVQPGLFARTLQAAAHWQALPQDPSPVSAEAPAQPPAALVPAGSPDPDAQLRKALYRSSTYDDPKHAAHILREIKHALAKGADPNIRNNIGITALMAMSWAGDLNAVKDLVHRGAKLDPVTWYGNTALLYAVAAHHPAIVKFLLKAGADLKDVQGNSLLPLRGDPEALGAALVAVQDTPNMVVFNTRASPEETQREAARKLWAKFDGDDTALLLLQLGALPNVRDNKGNTAIQYTSSIAVLQALIAHGADLKPENINGDSPIIRWAARDRLDLVKIALDHGANADAIDAYGGAALLLPAQNGDYDMVRLLLEHRADPNRPFKHGKDGRTPLMFAIMGGHLNIVELLLEHGAQVEAKDDYGETALTYAVKHQDREVARLLLTKGADINVRTEAGAGLLQILQERDPKDRYGIAELLKKAGAQAPPGVTGCSASINSQLVAQNGHVSMGDAANSLSRRIAKSWHMLLKREMCFCWIPLPGNAGTSSTVPNLPQ